MTKKKFKLEQLKVGHWYINENVKTGKTSHVLVDGIDVDQNFLLVGHNYYLGGNHGALIHRNGHYFVPDDEGMAEKEFIITEKVKCLNLYQLKPGAWYRIHQPYEDPGCKDVVCRLVSVLYNQNGKIQVFNENEEVETIDECSFEIAVFVEEIKNKEEALKIHRELEKVQKPIREEEAKWQKELEES